MNDLSLKQDGRYYHFICFHGNRKMIKKEFFSLWKIKQNKQITDDEGTLTSYSIFSTSQYNRGDFDNSVNRDGKAPFVFDMILFELPASNILSLGFPYKKLSIDIITSLVTKFGILKNSNFLKVKMDKLIQSFDNHTDILYNESFFTLGGVFLTLSGDNFLSSVKLIGKKPLESEIYIKYFKKSLNERKSHLEKFILKCKSDVKLKSSIQIDKFGNYKLYVQPQGRSLFTFPFIFKFFDHIACIEETPNNPVFHISENEPNEF